MEFSHSKQITFKCQVDTKSTKSPYDIIMGSDFLSHLGIVLDYEQGTITSWDGTTIPMKPVGALQDNTLCEAFYFAHTWLQLLQELEERQESILDADYSKVDIDALVNNLPVSSKSKQQLKVESVLQQIQDKGFRANPRKSFFMQKEVEYLGFLLTSDYICPQPKKDWSTQLYAGSN